MVEFETNETIENNLHIGSEKIISYKQAIKKLLYSEITGLSALEGAKCIVDCYEQNGGFLSDIIELKVFILECATHLLADFGAQMEDDFYVLLEEIFEGALKQLKSADRSLFDRYAPRLLEIIEVAQDTGYGYCDQLEEYWQEAFGDFEG